MTYALLENLVVALLVSASTAAVLLRLLPRAWLRHPVGAWLDRPHRPALLRVLGRRWHSAQERACNSGCCASGNACMPARRPVLANGSPRRIQLSLNCDGEVQVRSR